MPILLKKIFGRNLQADPTELLALLESVGYYRLKGYLIPFYLPKTEVFASSTTLKDITDVYMFDRHLREMALDAIARLEVAMRARIVKVVCDQDPNPLAYTDKAFFGNLSAFKHAQLLIQIANNVHRSKNEPFIAHAKREYGFEDLPPIWTIMEVLSFGTMMDFFEGLSDHMKIKISESPPSSSHSPERGSTSTFHILGRCYSAQTNLPLKIKIFKSNIT